MRARKAPAFEQGRCLAPGRQRHGIHAGSRFFRHDGEVLAKIERGRNSSTAAWRARIVADRREPAASAPGCLPDMRARRGKQLEQGSLAKEVQVVGVGVRGFEVPIAAVAGAGPAAVQARQGPLEEARRAALAFPAWPAGGRCVTTSAAKAAMGASSP